MATCIPFFAMVGTEVRKYREEPFTPVVAGQFCARSGRSLQRSGQAGRKNTTASVEWEVRINGRTKYLRWT